MAQTREADLYAQTGTRNYWLPEVIPYAQGSDHDVFLGLGIPATMLGHDPDWTHHTSEDKIDKTDASEFRRVGTFAATAAYWLASPEESSFALEAVEHGLRVEELARRVAHDMESFDSAPNPGRRMRTNRERIQVEADFLDSAANPERSSKIPAALRYRQKPSSTIGPRRLTLLPLDASVFEGASAEDAKWLAEQEARFASDSEGLATKPNFALISFEAVNFMDGNRSTAEIADLLSAEYLLDIDQAWVNRLVSILQKQKLVSAN
jgi:hypothetical protein